MLKVQIIQNTLASIIPVPVNIQSVTHDIKIILFCPSHSEESNKDVQLCRSA